MNNQQLRTCMVSDHNLAGNVNFSLHPCPQTFSPDQCNTSRWSGLEYSVSLSTWNLSFQRFRLYSELQTWKDGIPQVGHLKFASKMMASKCNCSWCSVWSALYLVAGSEYHTQAITSRLYGWSRKWILPFHRRSRTQGAWMYPVQPRESAGVCILCFFLLFLLAGASCVSERWD